MTTIALRRAGHVATWTDLTATRAPPPQAAESRPCPTCREDEIDYSIDYGEYTFDSQNFEDYRDNGLAGAPASEQRCIRIAAARFCRQAARCVQRKSAAATSSGAGMGAAGASRRSSCGEPQGLPPQCMGAAGSRRCAQHRRVRCRRRRRHAAAFGRACGACAPGRHHQQTARTRWPPPGSSSAANPSCDITLPDINVSRAHAELRFEPQGVWSLTDLGLHERHVS